MVKYGAESAFFCWQYVHCINWKALSAIFSPLLKPTVHAFSTSKRLNLTILILDNWQNFPKETIELKPWLTSHTIDPKKHGKIVKNVYRYKSNHIPVLVLHSLSFIYDSPSRLWWLDFNLLRGPDAWKKVATKAAFFLMKSSHCVASNWSIWTQNVPKEA